MALRRILEAPIGDLTFADVEALIREEAEEGPRLELKRGLPANDRDGDPWMKGAKRFSNPTRDGLAKEIVALANAYGGAIVVGIDETDDHPKRARGPDPVLIPCVAACAEQGPVANAWRLPRVDHLAGMAPPCSEADHNPARHCCEAQTARQGRLQGQALRSDPDRTGSLLVPALPAELP